MRISISGEDIPRELREVLLGQELDVSLTFRVATIHLDGDEGSIGGSVERARVTGKRGGGGLDPVVEENKRMAFRTMGTLG